MSTTSIFSTFRSLIILVALSVSLVLFSSCNKKEAANNTQRTSSADDKNGTILARPLSRVDGSSDSSKTLFIALNPEESGIQSEVKQNLKHPYSFFYNSGLEASGIAVGDIDGDGLPDLFLASSPGGNRLYRQVSPLKFKDITQGSGLEKDNAWGRGASIIDIDNDGDLDIYVANYGQENSLYINTGKEGGTVQFVERAKESGLGTIDASLMPSFCDYDNDGDLDLYLITNEYRLPPNLTPPDPKKMIGKGPNGKPMLIPPYDKVFKLLVKQTPKGPMIKWDKIGRPDYLYRNNGNGTFEEITEEAGIIPGGGRGLSATWWDYNDDGLPDLYVGNDWGDRDFLYHNNGDGTFRDAIEEAVPYTTMFSMGADTGDLNNDGKVDFILADMSGTTHYKRKISMGSMEASTTEFMLKARPPQNMRNVVYYNTGTRRVLESAYLVGMANSDWTWSVKIDDLNNDGLSDVFFTNGMEQNIREIEEGSEKTKTETQNLRKENNLVFQNLGNYKFSESGKDWGLDHFGFSLAAVNCDFDRDGDIDVFVMHRDEPPILYKNTSKDSGTLIKLKGTKSNRDGIGTKIIAETDSGHFVKQINLARGYLSSDEPVAHFGITKDTEISRLLVQWPSGISQEFKGLKGGSLYEITESTNDSVSSSPTEKNKTLFKVNTGLSGVRHKELKFDDFKDQPLLPNKLSQLGPGMAVGDIDGDGDEDFVLGGAKGSLTQIIKNKGNGSFSKPEPIEGSLNYEDMGILLADTDGDGDQDLIVVSGGVESSGTLLQDRLYINDGTGNFSLAPESYFPRDTDSGGPITTADVDRDGDLDIFIGGRVIEKKYPTAPRSRLLINTDGKFKELDEKLIPALSNLGLVTGATFTDINDDGWQDLIITREWGPITYLQNDRGNFTDQTEKSGLNKIPGWWNGVSAADLDLDGDIDLVASNFGLNTKYHASNDHPVLLYYGKFGTDEMRLVEAEYENGQLFPVRGKSCSTRAIPHLAQRFNTFHSFALAELNEVYTPQEMKGAQKFSITELNSGILLNDGNAQFNFKKLPKIAQIAPSFGIVVEDMNGDSFPDLFLAQNFYHSQVETGRMSGGMSLMLTGLGDGTFKPMWPSESGIIIPSDAKSACKADLNGDSIPDILVSSNDGPVRSYITNADVNNTAKIRVILKGQIRNPNAIGAKVIAHDSDSSKQMKEVQAGKGYLSQSTPHLFFGAKGKTIQRFMIRWPDGELTDHKFDNVSRIVTLSKP
ncbi:MAG: FG-GAP-like repeat-containing protein [Verrucomicrobiota bacterium]|nr:FG-GAP-like repeat-containing protein [Verrucomicrobiota bacterium]